ncbi:MAG: M14 family zinc carboxypeptidase [Planctomycetota bacterium]
MKSPRLLLSALTCLWLVTLPTAISDEIHDAARFGDSVVVRKLLQSNPLLANARTATNETPLHHAVLGRKADIIELLLATGADVTAQDSLGRTPLHLAAVSDDPALLNMLLAAGADPDAVDQHGNTPLHIAARRVKSIPLLTLVAAGADVNVANDAGLTPLHVLGADMRVRDEQSMHLAESLAEFLVRHGADITIIADGLPGLGTPAGDEHDPLRGSYRTYDEIAQILQDRAFQYPDICQVHDLGSSVQGRRLRALNISDNVGIEEDEPEFKYVSTMHGDEIVGNEMCLFLIDHLLTNYGTDPDLTALVDEIDIWIVPLMNPDGYVAGTRGNAHGIDLNRNFPEWTDGDPNTTAGREAETAVIMNWTMANSFTCSANLHTGVIVVNYPFDDDDLGSTFSPTPDEDLFVYISEEYSQYNLPMWNSPSFYHGITNGADWYSISGGMQDWHYRYMGGNEVTLELSNIDNPPYSQIPQYWDDNRDSMLAYMQTCLIGVRGLVTDVFGGEPVDATVTVIDRDHEVYTDPDVGDYHRMLMPGTYQLLFEAPDYLSQTHTVVVPSGPAVRLDVAMSPQVRTTYPNGGEQLPINTPVDVTWIGDPAAQYNVQYTHNYGEQGTATDGFEDGSLDEAYTTGGDADWYVTGGAHSGTFAARAGDISHNQTSWMTRTVSGGLFYFWYKVSSEANYDYFNFYIDDIQELHVSGYSSWLYYMDTLSPGEHELRWEYVKDNSVNGGSDTVWIDDLQFNGDATEWTDIVALTDVGATSVPWTPTQAGTDYKVRVRAYWAGSGYGNWDSSDDIFEVTDVAYPVGDMNCDTNINAYDIDPFICALSAQCDYESMYPDCDRMLADCNGDGDVNSYDIDTFIMLVGGG